MREELVMIDLTCSECDEQFEVDFPYGDDVQCPHCRTQLETDSEYGWDSMHAWVVGKSLPAQTMVYTQK